MERLNDCFAAGDRLLTVGEAAERLRTRLGPAVGRERIPLAEARGRILAAPLVSSLDVPGYDNAAVDGYAFAHGQAHYRIAGRAAAIRLLDGRPIGCAARAASHLTWNGRALGAAGPGIEAALIE